MTHAYDRKTIDGLLSVIQEAANESKGAQFFKTPDAAQEFARKIRAASEEERRAALAELVQTLSPVVAVMDNMLTRAVLVNALVPDAAYHAAAKTVEPSDSPFYPLPKGFDAFAASVKELARELKQATRRAEGAS